MSCSASKWPNKPDVVFEGGNVATDGSQFDGGIADLCLLSTNFKPVARLFTLTNATSAATAQTARIAALISAEYPTLWPETLRALLVHSAEWTPQMRARFDATSNRQQVAALLHRYGYGVPSVSRALRSANDALTLVVQSTIRPFDQGKTREMHVHELPWPVEALQDLEEPRGSSTCNPLLLCRAQSGETRLAQSLSVCLAWASFRCKDWRRNNHRISKAPQQARGGGG